MDIPLGRFTKRKIERVRVLAIVSLLIFTALAFSVVNYQDNTQAPRFVPSQCGFCYGWQDVGCSGTPQDTLGCDPGYMYVYRECPDINEDEYDITGLSILLNPASTCEQKCVPRQECNVAPDIPTSPIPSDLSTDIPTTQTLSWTATDTENDPLTFDVLLDTVSPPTTTVATDLLSPSYSPTLSPGTTYYWQVISKDYYYQTSSPIWEFTTVPKTAVSISLSPALSLISWDIVSLPSLNTPAEGNNNFGPTAYTVSISTVGTNADLYIRGDGDLTSGGNTISLSNEKYNFNIIDPRVPTSNRISLTTDYADNLIASNIPDGATIYLKFYLDALGGQSPGTYTNSVSFSAVPTGSLPP